MKLKSLLFCIILSITAFGYAQNVSAPKYKYQYRMVQLDSTYDAKVNPKLAKYVAKKRAQMEKQMQVVIAHTDAELESFALESPLSNFLTDILLNESSKYVNDTTFDNLDLSMLNFGGIRTSMPAGDVTVGDLFRISPFDNYLTFIVLKGSELRRALGRFNDKFNAPYSGATIIYKNNKPVKITVQGKPIEDNRLYKLVTLNFISDGGDKLLEDIQYEKIEYTAMTFRDFLIAEIKALTARGEKIVGKKDGRAVFN
ncbi:MAG: 5'-nucleotidase C-terminal domain-containing protein [Bacteroidales bacterium]|jgi:2',3'-cyclic-nucleotide 2'-phosphodiesterase (5'-nucleotidase family)|nr:5'-nucleotidase C-terminal domain-containing protein [Bacteroidales bacterium]